MVCMNTRQDARQDTSSTSTRTILEFMNSPQGRTLRSGLGSLLLLRGGNVMLKGLGAVLVASGPLDFCPTNLALGYPLSGADTRRQLAEE